MLNIYALQTNPTVGNIENNLKDIFTAYKEGVAEGADLVITPEGAVTGYPAQDLILRPNFVQKAYDLTLELASHIGESALLVNVPMEDGEDIYNVSLVLKNGKIIKKVRKHHLFNSGPLDEERVFTSANDDVSPLEINGVKIGLPICQDAWEDDVCKAYKEAGADVLISINASPYYYGKDAVRQRIMRTRVSETGLPILYLALVGGQDDVLFDGRSFVMNPKEDAFHILPAWQTGGQRVTFNGEKFTAEKEVIETSFEEDIYTAIKFGLKEYLAKTGFSKVTLGLSGGVDSALVATVAADALGAENVLGILLPSDYTSDASNEDALRLANNLGIKTHVLPIAENVAVASKTLTDATGISTRGLTEENLQSRLRGVYLMAMSNATGALLLTTGNKSEVAVGYCTLYGDMNGAYNPIKDIWKTDVYKLCAFRNTQAGYDIIPENILTKAPSAELRPDQRDDDSLPEYALLDDILKRAVEENKDEEAILKQTDVAPEIVRHILHLLKISEFKRYQSAPGPRVSRTSFGIDRRYPLANSYKFR